MLGKERVEQVLAWAGEIRQRLAKGLVGEWAGELVLAQDWVRTPVVEQSAYWRPLPWASALAKLLPKGWVGGWEKVSGTIGARVWAMPWETALAKLGERGSGLAGQERQFQRVGEWQIFRRCSLLQNTGRGFDRDRFDIDRRSCKP